MADALGINARMLGRTETVYGTAPAGNWTKLPFVSAELGSVQGLLASDVLGLGRDPAAPARDKVDLDGQVVVPVDLRAIGQWLTWMLGPPTTTDTAGAAPYTHVFASGAAVLPSFALEIGLPDKGDYFVNTGLGVDSLALAFQRSGQAAGTIQLVGQKETRAGASAGGTPATAAFTRFGQFQGTIRKDGTALGNVVSASATFANGLEKAEVIREDGLIAGWLPGVTAFTGQMTVRFTDNVLLALAEAGGTCELTLGYVLSASQSLLFTAHEVHLPKPKQKIAGPGGLQAIYDWQAARDDGLGKMLTVTLVNDVESYS